MVIGLLILTSIPLVTGVAEGYSAQKTHKQRQIEARRMRRFNISVFCDANSPEKEQIHGGRLVLRDDKVWIAQPGHEDGYLASAFYIEYPDPDRDPAPMGLVSQVADNPPLLNWLYLDKDTMEVRYGNRSTSKEHYVGPWDWTKDESAVVYEDEEQFVAVQNDNGQWQVYFDPEDDQLQAYVPKARTRLQISLKRVIAEEEKTNDPS